LSEIFIFICGFESVNKFILSKDGARLFDIGKQFKGIGMKFILF